MNRRRLLGALAVVTGLRGLGVPALAGTGPPFAVAVTTNDAMADFPNGVRFSLAASADVSIERVELIYRIGPEATLNAAIPALTPGERIETAYDLDARLNFLPPGVDLTYRWRLWSVDGGTAETEPRTLPWEDTRFTWQRFGTDQLAVFAYHDDRAFGQSVYDSAQRTVFRLQTDFGVPQSVPLRIWVYTSREDFALGTPPNSEPWIAGVTYIELLLTLAVVPPDNAEELGRVIPHEVSHLVLEQATANPYNRPPRWLDEGLAVYNQDAFAKDHEAEVRAAATEDRLLSIRALNSEFPYEREAFSLAYDQSLSIVNYIVATDGTDGMASLIAAACDGVAHDDAVQQALGVSIDDLDRLWRESLQSAAHGDESGGPW